MVLLIHSVIYLCDLITLTSAISGLDYVCESSVLINTKSFTFLLSRNVADSSMRSTLNNRCHFFLGSGIFFLC